MSMVPTHKEAFPSAPNTNNFCAPDKGLPILRFLTYWLFWFIGYHHLLRKGNYPRKVFTILTSLYQMLIFDYIIIDTAIFWCFLTTYHNVREGNILYDVTVFPENINWWREMYIPVFQRGHVNSPIFSLISNILCILCIINISSRYNNFKPPLAQTVRHTVKLILQHVVHYIFLTTNFIVFWLFKSFRGLSEYEVRTLIWYWTNLQ